MIVGDEAGGGVRFLGVRVLVSAGEVKETRWREREMVGTERVKERVRDRIGERRAIQFALES